MPFAMYLSGQSLSELRFTNAGLEALLHPYSQN
jgi:hypothetical protein